MSTWGGSYGSSGQVLTSGGSGSSWAWTTPSTNPSAHMTVFTSNGTFTPPSNTSSYVVWVTGGGGGSGSAKGEHDDSSINAYTGGGGGGGTAVRRYSSGEMGSSASVTVGGGGSGGGSSQAGAAGGHTEFNPAGSGATLSGWGGGGSGYANESTSSCGSPGSFQNGEFGISGQFGYCGNSSAHSYAQYQVVTKGGETYWGDESYGRGGNGVRRTSDGWESGNSGAAGICIVYSY